MLKVQQYELLYDSVCFPEDTKEEFRGWNTPHWVQNNLIKKDMNLIYRFHWLNGMSKDSKIYKNHKDWNWKHIDWKTEEPYSYWAFDVEAQLSYFYLILYELPKNKIFIDSVQFNYLHYFYRNNIWRRFRNFRSLMLEKEIKTRRGIWGICHEYGVPVSFNIQLYDITRFEEMNSFYSDFLTFEITHRIWDDSNFPRYIQNFTMLSKNTQHYFVVDFRIPKEKLITLLRYTPRWLVPIFSYFPLKNISNSELKEIVRRYK